MLAGNLKETGKRIENVFVSGGDNFAGLGSTLEAFDCNPFMYEYVFEKAWDRRVGDDRWIEKLADRHAGLPDENMRKAWKLLSDSVYIHPSELGQAPLTNARPTFSGNGNWTTNPTIRYSNKVLCKAWGMMLQTSYTDSPLYNFDIVNIGRQVLGNYFSILRDQFSNAYQNREIDRATEIGNQMIELMEDLDLLLGSESSFLLGKWITDSRKFGINENEKNYYEKNARTIITTWGDKNQSLNDYANRSWAGLTKDYYLPRWKMFIEQSISSLKLNEAFDHDAFIQRVTSFEKDWTDQKGSYLDTPTGNGLEIAQKLFAKYNPEIVKYSK
jgi:alpha-N-acetylglucosaminidase